MVNRQKVIRAFKQYVYNFVELTTTDEYNHQILEQVLVLLKEQEAIEPLFIENPYTHLPVSYCPKCREPISKFITGNPYKETKYCHYCGQEVRWE